MDRRKIEQITASLAVFLLGFMTIGAILAIANSVFEWDILPPDLEKILWFLIASCVAIIFSSVLVNVMLNLSIIALNSDAIAGNESTPRSLEVYSLDRTSSNIGKPSTLQSGFSRDKKHTEKSS